MELWRDKASVQSYNMRQNEHLQVDYSGRSVDLLSVLSAFVKNMGIVRKALPVIVNAEDAHACPLRIRPEDLRIHIRLSPYIHQGLERGL